MRILNISTGHAATVTSVTDIAEQAAALGVLPNDKLTTTFVAGQVFIRVERTGDVLTITAE